MLNMGTKMFLQIPDNSKKGLLYPSVIAEKDNDVYTSDFEKEVEFNLEQDFLFVAGMEIFVYHEIQQEFMKQAATVEEIIPTEFLPSICFRTTSEPVSAENRQCYRVSTVMSEMYAKFGSEDRCSLLDVSATGFAVSACQGYNIGEIVETTLYFEDQKFDGTSSIQSVFELAPDRFRYGMLCCNDKNEGENLQKGLEQICFAVQRQQLKRLSGAV